MKPRIYRRHPLHMHLGRAKIAEGVSIHCNKCKNDKHVDIRMGSVISLVHHTRKCDRCDGAFMHKNIRCRG